MEQMNGILTYLKTLNIEHIRDIVLALFVIFLFLTFSSVFSKVIIRIFRLQEKKKDAKRSPFYQTFRFLFVWVGIYLAIFLINLPPQGWEKVQLIFRIGMILIASNILANLTSYDSVFMKKLRQNATVPKNETMQKFGCKVLKVLIYFAAIFLAMAELNYDISGLLTGLGLSGVIFALAAQDLAKNLFGGMAIVMDKPFKVGDWITIGQFEGTVEDITFRSTRIRTLDDTEVTIQNSVISNDSIINWSKLGKRRHSLKLNLPFDLQAKTVDKIVKRIRFVLESNPTVEKESVGVFFTSIPLTGFEITIYMYTPITNYAEYMQFKNDINQEIVKVLESENVSIAYPGHNLFVHQEGQDFAKANLTENKIKNIKKKKEE